MDEPIWVKWKRPGAVRWMYTCIKRRLGTKNRGFPGSLGKWVRREESHHRLLTIKSTGCRPRRRNVLKKMEDGTTGVSVRWLRKSFQQVLG